MVILVRLIVCFSGLAGLSLVMKDLAPIDSKPSPTRQRTDMKRRIALPQAVSAVLLGQTDIQLELGIDDVQRDQIERWQDALHGQIQSRCSEVDFTSFGELTDIEIQKQTAVIYEMIHDAVEDCETELGDYLDFNQLNRLRQISLQREGLLAFRRREIIEQLELTKDQRLRLGDLPSLGFATSAPSDAREKSQAGLAAILTPVQQQTWRALTGDEFQFLDLRESNSALRMFDSIMGSNCLQNTKPREIATQLAARLSRDREERAASRVGRSLN